MLGKGYVYLIALLQNSLMEMVTMSNKYKIIASLFMVLPLIASGVFADSKPDWVEGDSAYYPNSQYMTATGSASDLELAKNRALGNLSKIFEAHIRSFSSTKMDTRVSINNGAESYTKKTHLADQIQVNSDKIISGARIAKTWKDQTVLTHHALAVLDRTQAGNNIKSEMLRIDKDTQIELDRSRLQSNVLLSMAALDAAVVLQRERQALQKMLKVIDARGKGAPAKWSLADLSGQLENKLQSLKISTAVDNDPIGKLDQSLRAAMGNAGFPAVNGSAEFILVANLDVQDLGFRQGWYWLRGKLGVKMVGINGKIRGHKQWPLKVSALQHNVAESRLMTLVSKKLNAEIKPAILEFSTGVK